MKKEQLDDVVLRLAKTNRHILGIKRGFRWGKYRTYECFSKKERFLILKEGKNVRFATEKEADIYYTDTASIREDRKNTGISTSLGVYLLKRLPKKVFFRGEDALFFKTSRPLHNKRPLKRHFAIGSIPYKQYALKITLKFVRGNNSESVNDSHNKSATVYLKIGKKRLYHFTEKQRFNLSVKLCNN